MTTARRSRLLPVQIDLAELPGHAGSEVGRSAWHLVTQERIQAFADATGDRQWIHIDEARAAAGPFGGTIAHGFLTLSLAPVMLSEAVEVTGYGTVINYGADRLRFPAPLRAGSRLRAVVELLRADEIPGGVQAVWKLTYEIEGREKPACVAEIVFRYLAAS